MFLYAARTSGEGRRLMSIVLSKDAKALKSNLALRRSRR